MDDLAFRFAFDEIELLDRLHHHSVVIRIEGASYRLRQHADLIPELPRELRMCRGTT